MAGGNKLTATETLLEGLNEPTLIWAPFIALQNSACQLLERMGRPWIKYTEFDDVKRWEDMDNGTIVGNPMSGMGVGTNMQHGAANIYMANSTSSEARWQSLKRTDRIGQKKQVRVWDLLADGTVDHKFLESLGTKEATAVRNIDALKELRDMIG